jgi:hypothetical protein
MSAEDGPMAIEGTTLDEVLNISQNLSPTDQLRLISQLSEQLSGTITDQPQGEQVDMLSMVGVGADLWSLVDVDAYLDEERASWGT